MDTIDSITIIAAAWGLLVLRLTLALILWPHGAQKVLGWFGGAGWDGTYQAFTEKMGIPPFLAKVAMLTEFFAPICLVLGVFTRIAALAVIIMMAVAMTKHVKNGYFANWSGKKAGEGVEFHLLYAGSALALLLTGPWTPGAWTSCTSSSADGGRSCPAGHRTYFPVLKSAVLWYLWGCSLPLRERRLLLPFHLLPP